MFARLLVLSVLWGSPATAVSAVSLAATAEHRKVSLTSAVLESDYVPSVHSALRLTDDLRMFRTSTPAPLDRGGGMDSDVRQILALILGFFPGFGLGHLVAKDKQGFILFLIIDIAFWVLDGLFWGFLWGHAWVYPVGAVIWLVIHVIQALDAYGEAGGPKIIQQVREKAVRIANSVVPRGDEPLITTRIFSFNF